MRAVVTTACLVCLAGGAAASAEEVKVNWSDPSKPGTVVVELLNGNVTVEGYEGREVVINATGDGLQRRERPQTDGKRAGLKKIGGTSGGLNVEEQNNVVRVTVPMFSEAKVALKVPTDCALKISCVNCDDLAVSNLNGDVELKNINGTVKALNMGGAVVAHSLNDDIVVKMRSLAPGKAMSFTSMNGDIDVTMPAAAKADFVISTHNGEIFTDFEVALEPSAEREVKDKRSEGGAFKMKINQNLKGKVNGGGPLMQFKNHNGDILIRKGA
jgi:DUF4097 and DUF4098 domain-containing protein YvlB